MNTVKPSVEETTILISRLNRMILHCEDMEKGNHDPNSEIYRQFSLETPEGLRFYRSLDHEFLLDILRRRAEELGHSPAQAEVFWVWRCYIRKRFDKWPYALKAAGLSKAAGRGGKSLEQIHLEQKEYEKLLEQLRNKAKELCRIPHPQEIPHLTDLLRKYADDWNQVIRDAGFMQDFFTEYAGIYKIHDLKESEREQLELILEIARSLGRPPLKCEVPNDLRISMIERCGSYRNVLYQIGLEPVARMNPFSSTKIKRGSQMRGRSHRREIRDCYYQVLNPNDQTRKDLEELYKISEELNYLPGKKEVDARLRNRLQKNCGSWANALYQLKYREHSQKA